jgi:carbon monoxide dehydrogenase subunit G
MTEIESTLNAVNSPAKTVFDFLTNINNHEKLMPSQVSEWWSNADEAKLKVQGLGTLHLKKDVIKDDSYIKIIPIGTTPVDLYIEWHIQTEGENCKVKTIIFADLNMFMKMVAMKPLQGLADYMASKINTALLET